MALLAGSAFSEIQSGNSGENAGTAPVVATPSSSPSPTPTNGQSNEVRIDCNFFGTFTGKNAGSMGCRARGRINVSAIHDYLFTIGDPDDFLRFNCRDSSDKPYYNDGVSYGVAPAIVDADGDNGDGRHFNAIITGLKTTAPLIVIQDINLRHLNHDGGSHESGSDGRRGVERAAVVSFNWYGIPTQIPGICRLRAEHHDGAVGTDSETNSNNN
jgi:hypothetical protein